MGISLCRNSALRGIRRARIHAIRRMTPFNKPTHRQLPWISIKYRVQRDGHKGSEVRPSEFLLLQKGNPGRNLTSLLHAAPRSLAPVHFRVVLDKARKRLWQIKHIGFSKDGLGPETALKLYKLLIRPILEYGAQVLTYVF